MNKSEAEVRASVLSSLLVRKRQFEDWLGTILVDDKKSYLEKLKAMSVEEFISLIRSRVMPWRHSMYVVVNEIFREGGLTAEEKQKIAEADIDKLQKFLNLFLEYIQLLD